MRNIVLRFLILPLLLAPAGTAFAQPSADETAVRAVIADWYQRVGKPEADMPWVLMAPGSINGGPDYHEPLDLNSGSAAIRGPYINNELAARALKFSYDIDVLVVDDHLAKARVWERGYFYAWAAQNTYENAAATLFVFEKRDGTWKILAHAANSEGIPPNKITDPMPDLREFYYQRCGSACDLRADAEKASTF